MFYKITKLFFFQNDVPIFLFNSNMGVSLAFYWLWWCLTEALVCITLMNNDAGHLYICYSKRPLNFLGGGILQFLLCFKGSLYILDIGSFSDK